MKKEIKRKSVYAPQVAKVKLLGRAFWKVCKYGAALGYVMAGWWFVWLIATK